MLYFISYLDTYISLYTHVVYGASNDLKKRLT